MTTFLIIMALPIFLIVTALVLYPVAQAFGLLSCNCGLSPEDKWSSCSIDNAKDWQSRRPLGDRHNAS